MLGARTARLDLEWNADRLRRGVAALFGGESIVVLANREPFRHERTPEGIRVARSSGGLVTALEPIIEACAGSWVAHGAGSADRAVVDPRDGVDVPPDGPRYRLRRVWLDDREERGYYCGCANEGLWPLCHRTAVRPVFRSGDFDQYRAVNARFADAVCDEVDSDRPLVLVQDYHFALAPRLIRNRLPLATIVAFWHIPWPSPAVLATCPWRRVLLDGLLGSTIVGFQTPDDRDHFLEACRRELGAPVDARRDVVTRGGREVLARDYPVSVEWPNRYASRAPAIDVCRSEVRRQLGLAPDCQLGVGVDRLDYTKGIEEKFLALERLFERQPELRGRFTFAQIAEPSRDRLPAYRELRARVAALADRVNRRFAADGWRPLLLLETRHEPADVYRFFRAADLCYVGSLHDGMNLVAKEFVSARDDERGALVLSRFAGAARELTAALLIDPHDVEGSADALARAVAMTAGEQATRLRAMRAIVARANAFRWAGEMLLDAARLRAPAPARPREARRPGLSPLYA